MRSVPHRVVCLLGLDDGVFPRKGPRDGDDLMLADPRIGERDARSEDRQLLLDALMAATDKLIVTYGGRDERTNLPRQPAVPLAELLELTGREVVVQHPLQPFDPRNFTRGELVPDRAWSFEPTTLDGARALVADRVPDPPFLPGPLPPPGSGVIDLTDLVRFFERPARAFLRQRLGISLGEYDDELEDALPVALDKLEEWGVGQRLLDARLAGVEPRASVLAEIARGTLPPGVLGMPVIHRVQPTVEEIVAHVPEGDAGSIDVKVGLADGRTIGGTVANVAGDVLRNVTYSRVNPRHRLAAWVRLLVLTVAHPGRTFEAVTIGRARAGSGVVIARIAPLDVALARDHLDVLIDLYDRGMREPAPLACLASAAYAQACRDGADPIRSAREAWESSFEFDREDREPEHKLVLGGVLTFEELNRPAARPDERWDPDETRRFGGWARRLWDGLLAHERLESL
jgi:exodeoxyribonuclease V gamma subunit